MAGTRLGGLRAAATNKKIHGDDFYARIGAKGGRRTVSKGFGRNPALARIAGAKGGKKSRRGRASTTKKVIREGKEMTKIIVRKIVTPKQEVNVYVNN